MANNGNPLGPGAWLTLQPRRASALIPPDDKKGATFIPPDDKKGATFIPPDDKKGATHIPPDDTPGQGHRQRAQPLPWRGYDPDWVYADARALQSQAVRRTLEVIARQAQAPQALAKQTRLQQPTETWERAFLRWGSEHRVEAVVGELQGQVRIKGHGLERLAAGRTMRWLPLLTLDPWPLPFAFTEQVDKVLRAAAEREDRLPEIVVQCEEFGSFFGLVAGFDPARAPRASEFFDAVWAWARPLIMQWKAQLAVLRPVERNRLVTTAIDTPSHGSLPSGHAAMAALTADLMMALLKLGPEDVRARRLNLLARRIAFNRVVAGVHFPIDSHVGHALGRQLAGCALALAGAQDPPASQTLALQANSELPERDPLPALPLRPDLAVSPLPMLQRLWEAASVEVEALGWSA